MTGKIKRMFWSIPALAVYFYVITILTEYGYASFFQIPTSFISASLSDNIIYFFQLFSAGRYLIGIMKFWMWISIFVVFGIVALLWVASSFWKRLFISIGTILVLVVIIPGFFDFGRSLGENTTRYLTPAENCPGLILGDRYIIPQTYGSKIILMQIDNDNKIVGGFTVKDMADMPCEFQYEEIGKVKN